jgi:hypothetical protein
MLTFPEEKNPPVFTLTGLQWNTEPAHDHGNRGERCLRLVCWLLMQYLLPCKSIRQYSQPLRMKAVVSSL